MFFPSSETNLLEDIDVPTGRAGEMAAYEEGYACGFSWPDQWKHKPGGPWVYTAGYRYCCKRDDVGCDAQVSPRFTCKENIAYAAQSAAKAKRWMQGWTNGNAAKNRNWTTQEHVDYMAGKR